MSTKATTFKVIQVSMPQSLLEAVTRYAKSQKESRAAFIRRALERYLAELREQEMDEALNYVKDEALNYVKDEALNYVKDEAYIQGYRRIPEEISIGETGAKLAAMVFSEEEW